LFLCEQTHYIVSTVLNYSKRPLQPNMFYSTQQQLLANSEAHLEDKFALYHSESVFATHGSEVSQLRIIAFDLNVLF
jgi:hypothetical protein